MAKKQNQNLVLFFSEFILSVMLFAITTMHYMYAFSEHQHTMKSGYNYFIPSMKSHLDPVGSVKFVDRISSYQETPKKTALILVSLCSIPSWNFLVPGFWMHTKGVISHPNME